MAKELTKKALINELLGDNADKIGLLLVNTARGISPFKTGRMMRSIDYRVEKEGDDTVIVLVAKTDYAEYQEEGTKHLPAGTPESPYQYPSGAGRIASRPFLAASAFIAEPKIIKLISEKNGSQES